MATRDRSVWKRVDDVVKHLAPVFVVLLVVYLYASFVDPVVSKPTRRFLEVAVVGYFAFELVVKYALADDYRSFLRNYWLDVVLLLPFFKALRLAGAVGTLLKSLKLLPYLRKAAKLPKLLRRTWSAAGRSPPESGDDPAGRPDGETGGEEPDG